MGGSVYQIEQKQIEKVRPDTSMENSLDPLQNCLIRCRSVILYGMVCLYYLFFLHRVQPNHNVLVDRILGQVRGLADQAELGVMVIFVLQLMYLEDVGLKLEIEISS